MFCFCCFVCRFVRRTVCLPSLPSLPCNNRRLAATIVGTLLSSSGPHGRMRGGQRRRIVGNCSPGSSDTPPARCSPPLTAGGGRPASAHPSARCSPLLGLTARRGEASVGGSSARCSSLLGLTAGGGEASVDTTQTRSVFSNAPPCTLPNWLSVCPCYAFACLVSCFPCPPPYCSPPHVSECLLVVPFPVASLPLLLPLSMPPLPPLLLRLLPVAAEEPVVAAVEPAVAPPAVAPAAAAPLRLLNPSYR